MAARSRPSKRTDTRICPEGSARAPVFICARGTWASCRWWRWASDRSPVSAPQGFGKPLFADAQGKVRRLRRRSSCGRTVGRKASTSKVWGVTNGEIAAGVVDDVAKDEEDAFRRTRSLFPFLPSELGPRRAGAAPSCDDRVDRREEAPAVDRAARSDAVSTMMRKIVQAGGRHGSFFEMGAGFGRSIITGFARFDGWPDGDPGGRPAAHGRRLDRRDRAEDHPLCRDLAETFHLPVVHLVDCPGLRVGSGGRDGAGTLRHGCRGRSARSPSPPSPGARSSSATCSVSAAVRTNPRTGWRCGMPGPRREWGSLPLAGGLEAAYRAELDAAPDPAARLAEIEARLSAAGAPTSLPHGGSLRRGGHHRSARDPPPALRLRQPGRPAAAGWTV